MAALRLSIEAGAGVTLNITVATDRCIYQSADYRLLDLRTDKTFDFDTQKIVFVHTFR